MLYNRETTFNLEGILYESGAWYLEQANKGNGKMVGFFHKGDNTARFTYRGKNFWQNIALMEMHDYGDFDELEEIGINCYNFADFCDSITAQKYVVGMMDIYSVVDTIADRMEKARKARLRDVIASNTLRRLCNRGLRGVRHDTTRGR